MLTVNFSAEYDDETASPLSIEPASGLEITLATDKIVHTIQSIGTSEEAIELGDISSRGFAVLVNLDPTNYIEIKVATSGAIFAKLFPKGSTAGINFCVVHLGSAAQSPFATANSAECKMEIFLCAL
jgi:hypothetical protein